MLEYNEFKHLQDELFRNAFNKNVRGYADYVLAWTNEHVRVDSAVIGVSEMNVTEHGECHIRFLRSFLWQQPEKALDKYEKYSIYDPFIPILAQNDLTALDRCSSVQPYEEFCESLVYRELYSIFGIRQTIGIVFRIPGSNRFIFSGLFRAEESDVFTNEEIALVQAIFPQLFFILAGKFELYNCHSNNMDNYIKDISLSYPELTRRQAEILHWMVQEEITASKKLAKVMQISPKTVENLLGEIYRKLDCHSKLELIAKIKDFPV
jgi:DNA-binding CsgD family transcriptional regulator